MHVEDEDELLLLLSQEIFECYCLWFREGVRASIVVDAGIWSLFLVFIDIEPRVGLSVLGDVIDLSEIDGKVSVQINTSVTGLSQVASVLSVHILSLRNNFVVFVPALLDESNAVHVQDRNEVELVILEQLFIMRVFLDDALV